MAQYSANNFVPVGSTECDSCCSKEDWLQLSIWQWRTRFIRSLYSWQPPSCALNPASRDPHFQAVWPLALIYFAHRQACHVEGVGRSPDALILWRQS